uniref:Transmembrane protein 237a n=1 Tax=Cynoglossus semilaevis TaxID=244447 RepID=A0A3P8X026_CYNSE
KTNATENYSIDLRAENDDVITDIQSPLPQQSLFFTPHGLSQSVGKVFVDGNTKRDVAMRVHSGFVIGLFSQGLLAGFAVWSVIVVYILAGDRMSTLTNLLVQYHPLAYLSQSLQYLLLTISTVSAFDLNLGKTSTVLSRLLTLDSAALTSVYFISLTLSLSQQMTSDRINHYPSANHTLPPSSEQQILRPWIAVNFVVALLAGAAWAVISTGPDIDYTEFLMSMEVQG